MITPKWNSFDNILLSKQSAIKHIFHFVVTFLVLFEKLKYYTTTALQMQLMAEKKVIKLRNIIAVNNYKQPSEGHNRIFLWILINSSRAERKNFEIKRNGLAPRVCFVLSSFGGVPENFFFQCWIKTRKPQQYYLLWKNIQRAKNNL